MRRSGAFQFIPVVFSGVDARCRHHLSSSTLILANMSSWTSMVAMVEHVGPLSSNEGNHTAKAYKGLLYTYVLSKEHLWM